MTTTGRSFQPVKPIIPAKRRMNKQDPKSASPSKVVNTHLPTGRSTVQVVQEDSSESVPSLDPYAAALDDPMSHLLHSSASFPPYHPVVDMSPQRMPSFPSPSRYSQGYVGPRFPRFPSNSQRSPAHQSPARPSYPLPSWAGYAFRGDPGVNQWRHPPLGYQQQYCMGHHHLEHPNNSARGAKDGSANRPILLDATVDIVTTELQGETASTRQLVHNEKKSASPTPTTPHHQRKIPYDDLDGKKIVLAVSSSPTTDGHPSIREEPTGEGSAEAMPFPDSPGQVFSSYMDDTNESVASGSLGNFKFLPYLEDESGRNRSSPPMIPFLSSESLQLSWELPCDEHHGDVEHETKGNGLQSSKMPQIQLKPNSQVASTALSVFGRYGTSDTQSLFHEDAVVFGQNATNIEEEATFDSEDPPETSDRSNRCWHVDGHETGIGRKLSRDDVESEETGTIDRREALQLTDLSSPDCPRFQIPREHFDRLPQSTPRTPHFAMPLCPNRPQMSNANSAFLPGIGASRSFPSHVYPMRPPTSTRRCVPLTNPVPSAHQAGSAEMTLPEFSELVNFPNSLRESRALPAGMKCCVMCGAIRPTCSRLRSRKNRDAGTIGHSPHQKMGASYCEDSVTIPTQNKGLCTLCDISVWVVKQSGCQIKWCKGCKNFRRWALFGDKGFATKCGRCRERQREKYALLKDAKMHGTTVHHAEKRKGTKGRNPKSNVLQCT